MGDACQDKHDAKSYAAVQDLKKRAEAGFLIRQQDRPDQSKKETEAEKHKHRRRKPRQLSLHLGRSIQNRCPRQKGVCDKEQHQEGQDNSSHARIGCADRYPGGFPVSQCECAGEFIPQSVPETDVHHSHPADCGTQGNPDPVPGRIQVAESQRDQEKTDQDAGAAEEEQRNDIYAPSHHSVAPADLRRRFPLERRASRDIERHQYPRLVTRSKSAFTIMATRSSNTVVGAHPSFSLAFVASPMRTSTSVGR